MHLRDGDGQARQRGEAVAEALDLVQELHRAGEAQLAVAAVHEVHQVLLAQVLVEIAQLIGDGLVEDDPADGGVVLPLGGVVQVLIGQARFVEGRDTCRGPSRTRVQVDRLA